MTIPQLWSMLLIYGHKHLAARQGTNVGTEPNVDVRLSVPRYSWLPLLQRIGLKEDLNQKPWFFITMFRCLYIFQSWNSGIGENRDASVSVASKRSWMRYQLAATPPMVSMVSPTRAPWHSAVAYGGCSTAPGLGATGRPGRNWSRWVLPWKSLPRPGGNSPKNWRICISTPGWFMDSTMWGPPVMLDGL